MWEVEEEEASRKSQEELVCVCVREKEEPTSSSDLSAGSLTGVVWCVCGRERKRRSLKERRR